ncbi:MAG TPA: hypothetical protein VNJ54_06410 [Plantibacter sp.]|uniref:hypothetical protein n=1 Tax=unclassified Plantibacter TaxID=2624265 RepID=UPI002C365F54|nr:hypothetical protein [Plantibacter sp.]
MRVYRVSLSGAPASFAASDAQHLEATLPHPVDVQEHIRATVQVTVPVLSLLGITETPSTLDGYGPIDADTAARLTITAPSMTRLLTHPAAGGGPGHVISIIRWPGNIPAPHLSAISPACADTTTE